MTLAAQTAGSANLVIDSSARDASLFVAMGFSVFSRGLSIIGTNKNPPGCVGAPIVFGGVRVNNGDIIIDDCDGLVVVRRERAAEVARLGRAREAKEKALRAQIRSGRATIDLLGLAETMKRLGTSCGNVDGGHPGSRT